METTIEILKVLPALLWFLLALALIMLFYKPVRHELIPNLTALKALGVEMSFIGDSLNFAFKKIATKTYTKGLTPVNISDEDEKRVIMRVQRHLHILRNVRILWIDDVPANNQNEEQMFRQLNIDIEFAASTKEALKKLKKNEYDLIFSDMSRGDEPAAGIKFLEEYQRRKNKLPVIFYVGTVNPEKGTPAGAFGLTHRPDELLHLTLDALERKKY